MTPSELVRVVHGALAELDLAARVAKALPPRPRGPIRVVAIGKAAPAMAKGALVRWGDAIDTCLVVTPDGVASEPRFETLRAGHPLPDARSLRAGERCFDVVSGPRGVIVVLVSGGASALVCAPSKGVTLADKRAVTEAMLRSGASIRELNVVRKHLSRIKGGGLLHAARPSRVITIIASDVIGGDASDVGSGPSVVDTSTVAEARKILALRAPAFARFPLSPTKKTRRSDEPIIVASPEKLAALVAARLRREGIASRVLAPSQSSVEDEARELLARVPRLQPATALVRAAEPSVEIPARSKGRGGRSTHLAALVGRDLPPDVIFLALATDGVDGRSGTAGAIVRAGFASARAIDRALATFDTGPLHVRARTALPEHATGHNLADVHVLLAL